MTTQGSGAWTTLALMACVFGGAAIGGNAYSAGGNLGPRAGNTTGQLIMFHLP